VPARPRAVIVVTGSELVRGDRRDRNGPFLARELVRLGIDPVRVLIVGDRPVELEAALHEALEADLCITSGGLGPTHDDRTVEFLAKASGLELRVDPALEVEIEAVSRGIAERLGRPYADFAAGVRKQASLPAGAVSLGLAGTAPGVLLERDDTVAIALPGPPAELRRIWQAARRHAALGRLVAEARPRSHRLLRFFGPSESAVARVLDAVGGEGDGVEVTVCARDFEIHVDLYIEVGSDARGQVIEEELLGEFGRQLFAEDERPVEEIVLEQARERELTLATAESCTGGMVGQRLTGIAGSSDVYVGGIVAYANAAKVAQLGVPEELLATHGAVSAETAAAMASGARARFGTDLAASVTGIAGPGGGTPEKPVGLVFLHVAGPGISEAARLQLPGDREAVRARATAYVLHLLRRVLTQRHDGPA
jgi:nicotinamide-nucleotide amidase